MDRLYSYSDYEYAYYHQQWDRCIEIGKYLLSYIHNNKAEQLLKQLSKVYYSWDMPERDSKRLAKILLEVKIWIMINPN